MLIFTRREGESFYIGDDVKITYLGTSSRNQVRIGIEAPTTVKVHREEVKKRIDVDRKIKS